MLPKLAIIQVLSSNCTRRVVSTVELILKDWRLVTSKLRGITIIQTEMVLGGAHACLKVLGHACRTLIQVSTSRLKKTERCLDMLVVPLFKLCSSFNKHSKYYEASLRGMPYYYFFQCTVFPAFSGSSCSFLYFINH